jgi:signal peptide peptidase SppA
MDTLTMSPTDDPDEDQRPAEVRLRVRPRCPRIVRAVLDTPWAILPDKLEALAEFIELRAIYGMAMPPVEIDARAADIRSATRSRGTVAVLPVMGTLMHRANMMTNMSGGTSTEQLSRDFATLLENPQVSSIVLDIDSPGGAVGGIQELADQVMAAREVKPVVAVANGLAASAAYWIATQASELVVSPSGMVGSIGVVALHQDLSARAEREGIKTTLVSAGRYKTEGNQFEALTGEARAAMQDQINVFYDAFVSAVARGRGVDAAAVRGGFGEGRTVLAKAAVRQGMADRVATLDQTINRLLARRPALPVAQITGEMPADGITMIDNVLIATESAAVAPSAAQKLAQMRRRLALLV